MKAALQERIDAIFHGPSNEYRVTRGVLALLLALGMALLK
jgi:hypothetical protein